LVDQVAPVVGMRRQYCRRQRKAGHSQTFHLVLIVDPSEVMGGRTVYDLLAGNNFG
jgi:hypothetical protein